MTLPLIFFVASLICFTGVAVFAAHMTGPNEVIRWVAAGLALFVAGHVTWPTRPRGQ
jgi:hypothetical protein